MVLADGTYATVTEAVGGPGNVEKKMKATCDASLWLEISFLEGVVAVACTKIALKSNMASKSIVAGTLKVIAGVGKLAESKKGSRVGVHADCIERLAQCARIMLDPAARKALTPIFLKLATRPLRTWS